MEEKNKMSKRKRNTILRTIFMGVSMANEFFCAIASITDFIENDTFKFVYNMISLALMGLSAVLAWWYNNSYTPEAEQADEHLDTLKKLKKEIKEKEKIEYKETDVNYADEEGE